MPPHTARRSIVVIGTGGTIAAMGTSTTYDSGVKSIGEVMNDVSLSDQDIQLIDYSFGDSIDKTDRDHIKLSAYVQDRLRDESVCGVVVTHGTDTLAELAAFMSFTLHSEKPAVITGAIRPSTERTADGFANLQDALVVAQQGHKRGCMVVFQQKILSAAQIGLPIHLRASFEVPSVEVFFCHSSFPVNAVRDSINRGVEACVFIAFGDGYWAAGREAIAALLSERKIPSVIISQANGCFMSESNAGFGIPGGWLRLAGARALLILCLIEGMSHDEIEDHIRKRSRQGDLGTVKSKL